MELYTIAEIAARTKLTVSAVNQRIKKHRLNPKGTKKVSWGVSSGYDPLKKGNTRTKSVAAFTPEQINMIL